MLRKSFLLVLLCLGFALSLTAVMAQDAIPAARFAHLAPDAGQVNIMLNGQALDGIGTGSPTIYDPGDVTAYLNFPPGTYSTAIVPAGESLENALVVPMDIVAEAGHQYTAALIGNAEDGYKILSIDETAAMEGVDLSKEGVQIYINNVKGSPALDTLLNGEVIDSGLKYGEYHTFTAPVQNDESLTIQASGDPETVLFPPFPFFTEPNSVFLAALVGNYPGEMFQDFYPITATSTPLDAADFLASFEDADVGTTPDIVAAFGGDYLPQKFKFSTLLKAFDAAGLTDALHDPKPFILFAPTDEAFANLPEGTLDAWMADPQKLASLLQYHMVKGFPPPADENGTMIVTSVQGDDLSVMMLGEGHFTINGGAAGCGCNYQSSNGLIYVVDHVLMPPE